MVYESTKDLNFSPFVYWKPVRSGAAGHQGPEKTGVGEQPPGESVEEDGEQPTEELVEGGGEQSPVKPVEPVEGGGGKGKYPKVD